EQDYDFTFDFLGPLKMLFAFQRPEALNAQRDRVTDSGSVFILRRSGLRFSKRIQQIAMIERKRALAVGESCERDQTDQAVFAPRQAVAAQDELADDFANGSQAIDSLAVNLEVERLHAAGAVNEQLNRDPLRKDSGLFVAFLGTSQRQN